jgi:dipeptidyl aminopeptidase/acylaminoacyl peptidase
MKSVRLTSVTPYAMRFCVLLVAFASPFFSAQASSASQSLTLTNIANAPRYTIKELTISPDGAHVAYVRTRVGNSIMEPPTLWVVPASGGRPRLIGNTDLSPVRWSPNSREIETFSRIGGQGPFPFLANDLAQISAYDLTSGKSRIALTSSTNGVDFAWSPDGKVVAIVGSALEGPRPHGATFSNGDLFENKWEVPLQAQPEVGFRGFGYSDLIVGAFPRKEQVEILGRDGRSVRKQSLQILVQGGSLVWAPDGASFAATVVDTPTALAFRPALHVVEIDAGSLSVRRRSPDSCFAPVYAGPTNSFSYLCAVGLPPSIDLFVNGHNVSQALGLSVYDFDLVSMGIASGVTASDGSGGILAAIWDGSASRLSSYRAGKWTALSPVDQVVFRFSVCQANGRVAYAASNEQDGTAIYVTDVRGDKPRRIAVVQPPAGGDLRLREVHWRSHDGHVLNGLVILPPGDARSAPLLVDLHGGPQLAWTYEEDVQAEYFASRGYVVFKPNPRGSAGYGAWSFASIRNDWASGPADDVVRGIDEVERLGYGDHRREFVRGDSYGGYLSAWLIEHVKRFAAAESGFAPYDLPLHYEFTDAPALIDTSFGPSPLRDGMSTLVAQSPQTDAAMIQTPVLIVAGRVDHRVPYPISLLFYKTLAERGADTRLLLFDSEFHGVDLWHLAYLLQAETAWYGSHGGLPSSDTLK